MSVETTVPVTDKAAAGEGNQTAQVALVCMPFAALSFPNLGLSLLKAALAQQDIACDIHYLNISFAERIGLPLYWWIWWTTNIRLLFGEWFFAQALFGRQWDKEHPLLKDLQNGSGEADDSPDRPELLRQARNDAGAYLDACLSAVPWEQYEIIGFSSMGQQNVASLALAKRIKAAWPDKVIVFGGPNCQGEMGLELHRQFPFIDFVCRGESDFLFPALVERLLGGASPPSLPGLILRRDDGQSLPVGGSAPPVTDLDSLPYPDFDDYFRQMGQSPLAVESSPTVVFESSRGCWYGAKQHCTFCGLNDETIAFRRKSPGRVLDELTYLTGRYGGNRLAATDNILDMRYLRDLVPEIIERDLDRSIHYEVKANLRKNQLRLLKRAGMDNLQPGIESLSTEVLKLMRKGCTALQCVQFLKWASELGIQVAWNFLMGFPGEEPEEYTRLAEMVPALFHLQPPWSAGLIRLDRFSPHFNDTKGFGITNARPAANYGLVYPFPEASLRRLAFFFDFDYADGRDPSTYTAPLAEMIEYWRANYCPGALTSVSNGQSFVIHDRRPGAKQARFELTGLEKAAYEYCDAAHTLEAIHGHLLGLGYAVDRETLRHRLEGWVGDRLMLGEGDRFLSLAVPADDLAGRLSDSDVIGQALAGAIAEWGDASRKKRVSTGAACSWGPCR
jgi:ribosomal peptide maturation radical SAM protein 1